MGDQVQVGLGVGIKDKDFDLVGMGIGEVPPRAPQKPVKLLRDRCEGSRREKGGEADFFFEGINFVFAGKDFFDAEMGGFEPGDDSGIGGFIPLGVQNQVGGQQHGRTGAGGEFEISEGSLFLGKDAHENPQGRSISSGFVDQVVDIVKGSGAKRLFDLRGKVSGGAGNRNEGGGDAFG